MAALIYEIVWFQLLELAIGSTAVSLAILLATFMGGACAGSLYAPKLLPPRFAALRVYALIELAIGILGLAVLWIMPLLTSRGLAVAALLPPTFLMGATLPALSRCVTDATHLGWIYAVNIAGAVFGSLLAGFYLLRIYDVSVATYAAVALNLAIALVAALWSGEPRVEHPDDAAAATSEPFHLGVLVSIALSGFTALAAESLWTRTLGLLFGSSVYTLSIVLSVFLAGLGIGSALASMLLPRLWNARTALAVCQLLLAGAIAWTCYTLSASLPYWPINPELSTNIWRNFELDLACALWAVLPPTILWGASFPFALAALGSQRDNAAVMARVYSANTAGAIVGAVLASLVLIPEIGSQHAEQLLIAISAIAGLLLLAGRRWSRLVLAAASFAACWTLITTVPPLSKILVAYGRYAATWVGKSDIVYAAEGLNSSVAVATFPNGSWTFHVAGKVQASDVPRDMRLQRMLGALTTLTVAKPRSLLVIGCGAGITAGAVSIDPRVERETIAEIEPLVPEAAAAYFSGPNFGVVHNPKVRIVLDDGRHFLLTTDQRFDGITIDPLDPWVKGAANLYTKEFYEAMQRHLNPGGSVSMYIQLFETTPEAVKSALATFFDVFPNATVWGNPYNGQGHDMVLLGQAEPLQVDLDAMDQRFGYSEPSNKIPESLAEVGMNSPEDLFAAYAGRASDLAPWTRGAPLNRDRNLRMQYLAGLGLDLDSAAAIYAEILGYRRFPADIFTGSPSRLASLRLAMAGEGR